MFLTNDDFLSRDGKVPAHSLSLVVSREIDGGMHKDLDITNCGGAPVRFSLEVALRCDCADTFEVKSDRVLRIAKSNQEYCRFFRQGTDDMAALRLLIGGGDHMEFMPAAGLPWFMAPPGRDSLIVSLQTITVHPEFARGALKVLGDLQAGERDDYRDAEPGKIMHELRCGELAHFRLILHTPYYGTADATPLWLIALHAAWRATCSIST